MKAGSIISLAAANGLIATALAALGSHTLAGRFAEGDQALFTLAANFQLMHALALFGPAFLASHGIGNWATRAAVLFNVGIATFSGSLYFRAVWGAGSLGDFHWVTPLGGMALMLGWIFLAVGGWRARTA